MAVRRECTTTGHAAHSTRLIATFSLVTANPCVDTLCSSLPPGPEASLLAVSGRLFGCRSAHGRDACRARRRPAVLTVARPGATRRRWTMGRLTPENIA